MSTPHAALLARIEAERLDSELSVRRVAPAAGLTEGRWRQIVKGATTPNRRVVAMAYAVSPELGDAISDELGMERRPEDPRETIANLPISRRAKRLLLLVYDAEAHADE